MRPSRAAVSKCSELRPLLALSDAPGRCLSRRCFSSTIRSRSAGGLTSLSTGGGLFFLPNRMLDRAICLDGVIARGISKARQSSSTSTSAIPSDEADHTNDPKAEAAIPPHRRRQARKRTDAREAFPADASSILSNKAAEQPSHSYKRSLAAFLALSKPRLSMLVVLSSMASYAVYPVPEMLSSVATETPSLSPLTLLFLTTGTALCSASANTFNMVYERSTDAIMIRTRTRPLVRNLISTRSAVAFGILAGLTGVGSLYFGVNPTVSTLGFANIVLYAGVYTPMKRVSALNTWIGAIVGGIPPLMGWAAAAGETATHDGSWRELLLATDGSSIGGWLMASLLFAWQFPHFMAISWLIRDEYKAAGLRMLAWTNPARNSRVALRYSLAYLPICLGLCAAGVTDWSFAITSLPINLWLARESFRFWKYEGHKGSARGLFWASVWHLPVVMILALLHKNGMWTRAWRSVFGHEDGEWEEEELEEMAHMTAAKVSEKSLEPRR
ncbi:mitochondria protoheme IX farnesyltransferase [Sarocladium strictum]